MNEKILTKDQERDALRKIKEILEGLGSDSYVAKAFEGCTDLAEENIECDFMISMRERWIKAVRECNDLRKENASLLCEKKDMLQASELMRAEYSKQVARVVNLESKIKEDVFNEHEFKRMLDELNNVTEERLDMMALSPRARQFVERTPYNELWESLGDLTLEDIEKAAKDLEEFYLD